MKSNAFHTTSNYPGKTLSISPYNGPNGKFVHFEANAFGNVDGGQLWDKLRLETFDFSEDVFRLMLKSHFDKGHRSNY